MIMTAHASNSGPIATSMALTRVLDMHPNDIGMLLGSVVKLHAGPTPLSYAVTFRLTAPWKSSHRFWPLRQ